MKTQTKFALLAAFGMALAGIYSYAQQDPGPQGSAPAGPPHARFGQVVQSILDQYDANKDGQLDTAEMAALKQDITSGKITPPGLPPRERPGFGGPRGPLPKDILDKYDANKDGVLDESERAALHKDIQDGKIAPPHFGAGRGGPMGQMGPPPTAQQILERFDANKDGVLDEAELTAFLNSMPMGRGPMHRGGPGGPPAADAPQATPGQ